MDGTGITGIAGVTGGAGITGGAGGAGGAGILQLPNWEIWSIKISTSGGYRGKSLDLDISFFTLYSGVFIRPKFPAILPPLVTLHIRYYSPPPHPAIFVYYEESDDTQKLAHDQ